MSEAHPPLQAIKALLAGLLAVKVPLPITLV